MDNPAILTPEQVEKDKNAKIAEKKAMVSIDDYDRAAEERLQEERVKRGYSDREPTDYALSTVERWAQDARDWSKFRDDVWTFAIQASQQYASTGIIPYTLDEFKEELSKIPCVWTFETPNVEE